MPSKNCVIALVCTLSPLLCCATFCEKAKKIGKEKERTIKNCHNCKQAQTEHVCLTVCALFKSFICLGFICLTLCERKSSVWD